MARNWDALLNYCKKSDTAIPGSRVHFVAPEGSKPMTMAQALIKLAANLPYTQYDWSEMDDKKIKETRHDIFWKAIENTVRHDHNSVGLFTQPQYERAFNNLKQVWVDSALESIYYEETDRQTDELPTTCLIQDN